MEAVIDLIPINALDIKSLDMVEAWQWWLVQIIGMALIAQENWSKFKVFFKVGTGSGGLGWYAQICEWMIWGSRKHTRLLHSLLIKSMEISFAWQQRLDNSYCFGSIVSKDQLSKESMLIFPSLDAVPFPATSSPNLVPFPFLDSIIGQGVIRNGVPVLELVGLFSLSSIQLF